jgi:hypothetical protein
MTPKGPVTVTTGAATTALYPGRLSMAACRFVEVAFAEAPMVKSTPVVRVYGPREIVVGPAKVLDATVMVPVAPTGTGDVV